MDIKNKHLTLLVAGSVASAILPMVSVAEDKVAIQIQHYQENGDRIKVQDGKVSVEHDFGPDHTASIEVDWDSISGASPTWWDSTSGASSNAESGSDNTATDDPCFNEDGEYDETLCRDTRGLEGIISKSGYKNLADSEFKYQNINLDDHRDSVAFLYTYRTPVMRNEISVGLSYSKEGDFKNKGASAEYMMYTDRTKNRAFTVGAAYMSNEVYDYLENTWNNFDLYNAQIGITQVFNAGMVGKFNLFYMFEDGHLSNPYFGVVRRLNVAPNDNSPTNFKYYVARETRPDKRKAGGISAQVVKQINPDTQWHLSYRYYHDSWSVISNTIESKSYHAFGEKFRFSPALRYYKQGAASFFKAHDARDNVFDETGYATADHRLGDYSSWTGQLSFEYLQTTKLTWNIVSGYQAQSSGLEFAWVNLGTQYKY